MYHLRGRGLFHFGEWGGGIPSWLWNKMPPTPPCNSKGGGRYVRKTKCFSEYFIRENLGTGVGGGGGRERKGNILSVEWEETLCKTNANFNHLEKQLLKLREKKSFSYNINFKVYRDIPAEGFRGECTTFHAMEIL